MSKVLIILCAFLTLAIAPSVNADPLVVTGGSLTVPGQLRAPQYSFTGQNFTVNGHGSEFGAAPSCFPCRGGELIGVNSVFVGGSLGLGSLIVNGASFDNLFFGGVFQFTGSPVLVPVGTTNISLTTPFMFSGNLVACPLESVSGPDCMPSQRIFSAQFVGQGLVTLQFRFILITPNGDSLYQLDTVTYNFDSAEVPEPLTITLLATGLVGLAVKRTFGKKRNVAE